MVNAALFVCSVKHQDTEQCPSKVLEIDASFLYT